jgi:hypothetical protein
MYDPWIEKIRKALKSSHRMKTFIERGRPPHDAANPLSGGCQVTIAYDERNAAALGLGSVASVKEKRWQ